MSMMIVLEGTDGVGKNTQSKRLIDKLDSIGRSAVLFSFPRYETPVGKAIKRLLTGETMVALAAERRQDITASGIGKTEFVEAWMERAPEEPLVLQTLMLADKMDAVHDMDAAIESGSIVVCDRWTPSALCFGEADGLDPVWLNRVQAYLPEGDLNLFIDVPEEEALRRRPQMRDRFEKDREKQKVIRANYETLWSAAAEDEEFGWVKIDGVGTEEEVAARIWKQVMELLELTAA